MSSQGGHDPGEVEEVRRLFREIHRTSSSKGKLSFKDFHELPSRGSVRLGNFVLPHEYASTTTGAVGSMSYVEECPDGLFYKAPDDDQFSDHESESECNDGNDDESLMHEPSKEHDAQQNSGEQASPETVNEDSCTLETPRDGSSIAPRHIVVDSRFHQDFAYQEDLGKGSYGIVEEYKHKLDMQRYAIKQITPKEGKSSLTLAKNEVRVEFSFFVS